MQAIKDRTASPVIGHTRPDVARVVKLLMRRSPEWNHNLADSILKRFPEDQPEPDASYNHQFKR